MTRSEFQTVFGTSVPVRYLDNNGVYHDTTADYYDSQSIGQNSNNWNDQTGYSSAGRTVFQYNITVFDLNTTPRSITVDFTPQYSIFDTEFIYTAIYLPNSTPTNISAYNSPVWNWYWSGNEVQFSASSYAVNNIIPQVNIAGRWCDVCPAYMESQAVTSGYSLRYTADHVSSDGTIRIYVGAPYISENASGNNGTSGLVTGTTAASGSSDINVNVDVDLTETNGILGTISSGISNFVSGILTGIQNFFIPSHDDITNFRNSLESSLTQHFGPLFTSRQLITSAFQNLDDLTVTNSFIVPMLDVPIEVASDGTVISTQSFFGNTVNLRPQYDKLHVLYDSLEIIINMIMTLWTVNTLRNMVNNYILSWHDYQEYDPEGVID